MHVQIEQDMLHRLLLRWLRVTCFNYYQFPSWENVSKGGWGEGGGGMGRGKEVNGAGQEVSCDSAQHRKQNRSTVRDTGRRLIHYECYSYTV